jgi:intracellular septation protein
MKFLFDLLPVLLFFCAFKLSESRPEQAAEVANGFLAGVGGAVTPAQAPILLATGVAILASFGQIGWLIARGRKVDTMLWTSLGIIVVFGGATLLLRDETFIKWKPTVLYWLFAAVLSGASALFKRNLIRRLLEEQVSLPDSVWQRLNAAWIGFFALMGAINLVVAFNFPTDIWVSFKLFGAMGLMLLFVLAQGLFLARYVEEK